MAKNDKNQGGALGKGLDALISRDYVKDSPTDTMKEELRKNLENQVEIKKINEKIVEDILMDVKKNPRISFWSAKTAAVLRFLRKTEPEFSISSEASILIEEAVKEKYPEIWELFEDHL